MEGNLIARLEILQPIMYEERHWIRGKKVLYPEVPNPEGIFKVVAF